MTLVDAKYYGKIVTNARKTINLGRKEVAQLLKISPNQLYRYEHGSTPFPEATMMRLMIAGLSLLSFKKCNKTQRN